MTDEEYYKIREHRHSRWKNMTDEQRKEIDDKLVERDCIYAKIEEYRKQGKIHPAEIEEAKKILSRIYNVKNTGSDIMIDDLTEMEAYAKDVLTRAGIEYEPVCI